MKSPLLAFGLAAVLTACGGGGGSNANTPSGSETGSIADTTSTSYTTALKAVAEVNVATAFMSTVHDLLAFAGQSGNCGAGGSLSYTATTQTLTLCQRNYPNNGAYSGTYTGTGSASGVSVTAINAVKLYDSATQKTLQYTVTSGNFTGSTSKNSAGADVSQVTGGSVVFNAGTSSAYTLTKFNGQIVNDGSSQNVSAINTSATILQVSKGGTTYDVTQNQTAQIVGNNFPSAGSASIAYSTTACSPIVLTYLPSNKFNMACGGHSKTMSWTDADVVAARAAAVQ